MLRGRPIRRRAPLAPESAKRRKERPTRAAVRLAVFERQYGECLARTRRLVAEVECAGPFEVHEVWTRGRFPGSHLDPALCVGLCRAHHRWATEHPLAAADVGLVVPSWEARP